MAAGSVVGFAAEEVLSWILADIIRGDLPAGAQAALDLVYDRHSDTHDPLAAFLEMFADGAGSIAHADPASDLPAVLRVLGATFRVAGPGGERTVRAEDFFVGLLETAVGHDEVLIAVEVPALGPGTGSAYLKLEHPASGYALCGAAAVVELDRDGSRRQHHTVNHPRQNRRIIGTVRQLAQGCRIKRASEPRRP